MKKNYSKLIGLLLAAAFCITPNSLLALTEVNVATAGTLASLLTETDSELKVTGQINGTDIAYVRSLVESGKVTSLDWSGVSIVAGGDAYFESYTTTANQIGEKMFYECTKLKTMLLPQNISVIGVNAFARSGLTAIDIPGTVYKLGTDCFAYCSSLATVVIGKKVTQLGQGVFYSSPVKTAYVKPLTPPGVPAYLFSSSPTIYVYTTCLADYKATEWKNYGSLAGGLENTYPMEEDANTVAKRMYNLFFEDDACTTLKAEYQAMDDSTLAAAFAEVGMPEMMTSIALKVKNQTWAAYEQDFRIHDYIPYSDASYWNNKMMASGGSYMGNPTGIYADTDTTQLFVFVDSDVPADATLYLAGCVENQLIYNAKTGTKLQKGLNVVDGVKDALYYVLYTADTKSMQKTLSEWPNIKIHIEGGAVNGYYDVSRKSDADYKALLKAAKLNRFTIRGGHSLYHLKTASFKQVFPRSIDKSIAWFDSVAVWEKNLMGMTEEVATGKKAGYPWYLTGGEAIYPIYYNNPNFAIEGEPSDAGYANSSSYRTSYNGIDCIKNCLDATNKQMDDWCAGHECGHNNQKAITLEGCTEVSNNVFSNFVRYLGGLNTSGGSSLATVMEEYSRREPYYFRNINSRIRFYWVLYLYYHLAQKNTSFYPELFKALRNDPLTLYNASNNNNGGLKFVRKVCEVAQEDLTDFFDVWGFFEPIKVGSKIEDYGVHSLAVTAAGIKSTKNTIAKYEKKNREILFVEDRADYVLSTGFLQAAGRKRNGSEAVGQYGELGQFTSYLPGACEPSEYVYLQADSLYAFEGKGGLGIFMLDDQGAIKYAANALSICIPSCIGGDFTIYSLDSDGSLHEIKKAAGGVERVELARAASLQRTLQNDQAIKLILSGPINSTDVKYLRTLITKNNLQSIDLSDASVVSGGTAYYQSYTTSANNLGDYAFHDFTKLASILLPSSLTKIGTNAFSRSGLKMINVPDKVTTYGGDAFAYCPGLTTVIIGSGAKTMSQGVFYSSPVKDAYVKALTPPAVASYLFSSKPLIHVYASAYDAYVASDWANFGTIVGDLTDDIVDGISSISQSDEYSSDEEVNGKSLNDRCYDLTGRPVANPQPGSIYIRGGKKFIQPRR